MEPAVSNFNICEIGSANTSPGNYCNSNPVPQTNNIPIERHGVFMCMFCCKEINFLQRSVEDSSNGGLSSNLLTKDVEKFIRLLSRQFRRESLRAGTPPDFLSEMKRAPAEMWNSCEDCSQIIGLYCELNHQLKCVELRLHWQIEKLWQIMRFADRVPRRVAAFKNWCKTTCNDIEHDSIFKFRSDLKRKCRQLKSTPLPRVILSRKELAVSVKCEMDVDELPATTPATVDVGSRRVVSVPPALVVMDKPENEKENFLLAWISSLTVVMLLYLNVPKEQLSTAAINPICTEVCVKHERPEISNGRENEVRMEDQRKESNHRYLSENDSTLNLVSLEGCPQEPRPVASSSIENPGEMITAEAELSSTSPLEVNHNETEVELNTEVPSQKAGAPAAPTPVKVSKKGINVVKNKPSKRTPPRKIRCATCNAAFFEPKKLKDHQKMCRFQYDGESGNSEANETEISDTEEDSGSATSDDSPLHAEITEKDKLTCRKPSPVSETSNPADPESLGDKDDQIKEDCVQCTPPKRFTRRSALVAHQKYLHSNGQLEISWEESVGITIHDLKLENFPSETKHHPCSAPDCTKVFALPAELDYHSKIYHRARPFPCHFCPRQIPSSALALISHEMGHSGLKQALEDAKVGKGKKFPCGRCNEGFDTNLEFANHYLVCHLDLGPFEARCPLCDTTFPREEQVPLEHYLNFHDLARLEDPAAPFRCPDGECTAYYLKEWQLKKHVEKDHQSSFSKCMYCSRAFISGELYQEHLALEHSHDGHYASNPPNRQVISFRQEGITVDDVLSQTRGNHECDVDDCSLRFKHKTDLQNHAKLHGRFKCAFCNVIQKFAPDLADHESMHASTTGSDAKKYKYACARCSFSSVLRWNYVAHHVETHLGLVVDKMRCPICQMAYRTDANTRPHKIVVIRQHFVDFHLPHGQMGENADSSRGEDNVLWCEHAGCEAYFQKPEQARLHALEVHQNVICPKEDSLKCKNCGQYFTKFEDLIKHRVVTYKLKKKDLKFVCNVPGCLERFETPEFCAFHESRSHEPKVGILHCPLKKCRKQFWSNGGFNRHLREGHPNMVCKVCGKSCKNQQFLAAHKRYHARKFECFICRKKIRSRNKFYEHVERVHKARKGVERPRKRKYGNSVKLFFGEP